jgi:ribosome biogenesis protein SSF1/2
LKDFLSVSGQLGISHFLILSSTDFGTYLRAVKVPQGPTLTFRLHSYALMRDIAARQLRPEGDGVLYQVPPLVRPQMRMCHWSIYCII